MHIVKTFDTHSYFYWIESIGFVSFVLWYSWLMKNMSIWNMLIFVLMSHFSSGILHVQIVISHWMSETCEHETQNDHYLHTLKTTMDIDCHPSVDWVHLGLQFQVAHHMFPRLPRCRLRDATKMVEHICRNNDLIYDKSTFVNANVRLLKNMYNVSSLI